MKGVEMANTRQVDAASGIVLDVERLDVYRVAREFDAFAVGLLPPRGSGGLRDQLSRASSSIVLNIAEGCGRFTRPEKAHFYLVARGSAMECAAIFDVALSRALISSPPTATDAA
jgi:four helix bundle protein